MKETLGREELQRYTSLFWKIIIGFDGEKPGAGERITAFVNQTGIPLAMVGILIIY